MKYQGGYRTSGPFKGYPRHYVESFLTFHRANPDVFDLFRRIATRTLRSGRKKYSAKVIYNVMRWEYDLAVTVTEQTEDGESFKLSDKYHAMYARFLAHKDERFVNFFEFRAVRAGRRVTH